MLVALTLLGISGRAVCASGNRQRWRGRANARDGLHPSDAGYRLWYDELNAQADFSNRLAAQAPEFDRTNAALKSADA